MDYILNVFNGDEFVISLCGNHMYYDNVIWWELSNLIKKFKGLRVTKEMILNYIDKESCYFKECGIDFDEIKDCDKIDFINYTISNIDLMIAEFKDTLDFYDIEVLKKDNKYYVRYDDGNEFLMNRVYFDRYILEKKVITFSEFFMLNDFIDECLELEDYDFVLNDNLFFRLNLA